MFLKLLSNHTHVFGVLLANFQNIAFAESVRDNKH